MTSAQEEEVQKNLIDKELILQTLHFRHACKVFDPNKVVSDEDINFILEAGRLSPSSFGMEHTKLIVITNQELKNQLKPYCWNQNQIDSCSHLIVLTARVNDIKPNSEYRAKMLARRGLPQEVYQAYLQKYDMYVGQFDAKDLRFWSEKQTYIVGANMATIAAMIGIDSCFIEGFEKEPLSKILGLGNDVSLSYIVAFGYRVNPQTKKLRLPLDEIVEYRS